MQRTQCLILAILLAPCLAQAGGFEHPDNGTVPLGRAGAFTARASDGTAFFYNIAGLAGQRGTNLMVLSNFTDLSYCFTRAGNYPTGSYGVPDGTPYSAAGPMCDRHGFLSGLGPMLSISTDLGNRRNPVFGFAVYGPSSMIKTGYSQDGEDVDNPALVHFTDERGRPRTSWAPNRFDLVEDHLDVIYFTPAIAHEIIPGLRVGAAFQWVLSIFEFTNYGALQVTDPGGGSARNELHAVDVFTPAFLVGAQYRLGRNIELGASFRWSGSLDAEGDLDIIATEINRDDPDHAFEEVLGRDSVEAKLDIGQAAQLRVGARFFVPRVTPLADDTPSGGVRHPGDPDPVPARPWDPMVDEIFDVELDWVFEANSAIEFLSVSSHESIELKDENGDVFLTTEGVGDLDLPHRYKDTHSLRLGGDWNILPGRLSARLGFSFETQSVPSEYTLLDFAPFARYGLYLGTTLRVGPVDISLAYGHLFQAPRTVTNGGGRVAGPGGLCDPSTLDEANAEACVINNGEYDANYDTFSIGTTWRF